MIKVKKLDEKAILPKKAKKGDSGYDICSIERKIIPVGATVKIKTGIACQPPDNHEFQCRPRSGLSSKALIVTLGTLDNNYRGEIQVIMTNLSNEKFTVEVGDRIAQIVPVEVNDFEVKEVNELSETVRGSNGFGSTGISSIQDKTQIFI